jgi:hypothetical protein
MKILGVNELPQGPTGSYFHFEHREFFDSGWAFHDVRPYVRAHETEWLNQIESWHSDLSVMAAKETWWWWITPASRLMIWQPPIFHYLYFAVAVVEICKSLNEQKVWLVGCPTQVFDYIRELHPDWEITHDSSKHGPETRELFDFLRNKWRFLKRVSTLVKTAFHNTFKNQSIEGNPDLIVYSHMLGTNVLKTQGDHFFGRMFEADVDPQPSILWFYYTSANNADDLAALHEAADKKGHLLATVDSLIRLSDVFRIIGRLMALPFYGWKIRRRTSPIQLGSHFSLKLSKNFIDQLFAGSPPMEELKIFFSTRRLLKHFSAKGFVYPYEEKGLERAILKACREVSPAMKTFGFAHAVYNQYHLYLRERRLSIIPRPDYLGVTGPAAMEWLINTTGIDSKNVVVTGSPRYAEAKDAPKRSEKLKILVLIGQGHELGILANWIERDPSVFENCQVLVRKYPYSWQEAQQRGMARIRRFKIDLIENSQSLSEQIDWCDVALYCSTSAGIEAMLRGRIAVYADLNDVFSLNPIDKKGNYEKVERCASVQELKTVLEKVRGLGAVAYAGTIATQSAFARQIYMPMDMNKMVSSLLARPIE